MKAKELGISIWAIWALTVGLLAFPPGALSETAERGGLPSGFSKEAPWRVPPRSSLAGLNEASRQSLVEAFRTEGLTNKVKAAWGIAHLGGPGALGVLREPLESDYGGKELTFMEERSLSKIADAIGYLGQRSGEAFQYLEGSLSPGIWAARVTWRRQEKTRSAPEVRMAGYAAMALAWTGREEALPAISKLARAVEEDRERMAVIAGMVVDAVFYLWLIKEDGTENLMNTIQNPETIREECRAFSGTEEGRVWRGWYSRVKGLENPRE